jgi:predicted ArsR family transcriptional regulator
MTKDTGDLAGGLLGGARTRLLEELCGKPQTATELAARVNTSASAVRVHLDGLRKAGMVDYRIERRGVGKPRHVYALTTFAESLLSRGYVPTLDAVLGKLRHRLDGEFATFLRDVGRSLAKSKSSGGRGGVQAAVSALESIGASVIVTRSNSMSHLRTNCCPLAAITRRNSEMCGLVESMLASASGHPVQEHCIRGEQPRCEFTIRGK